MEDQLVLRLPPRLAKEVRRAMQEDNLTKFSIRIDDQNQRKAYFSIHGDDNIETFTATLMDLPCNVEMTRSLDNRYFYKAGDLSQVLVVHEGPVEAPIDPETELPNYNVDSGLTAPTFRIKSKRYGKIGRTRWWAKAIHAKKTVTDLMRKEKDGIHRVDLVRAEDVEAMGLNNAPTYDVHGKLRRKGGAAKGPASDSEPSPEASESEDSDRSGARSPRRKIRFRDPLQPALAAAALAAEALPLRLKVSLSLGRAWIVDEEGGDSGLYAAAVGAPDLADETAADATRDVEDAEFALIEVDSAPAAVVEVPPALVAMIERAAREEAELQTRVLRVADTEQAVAMAANAIIKSRLEARRRQEAAEAEAQTVALAEVRGQAAAIRDELGLDLPLPWEL